MIRLLALIVLYALSIVRMAGIVVADSASRMPLPSASVFNKDGRAIGMTNNHGQLPYIAPAEFPVTVRYLGFEEKLLSDTPIDTVFLAELPTELHEVVVESRQHKVLHVLAYVREYSTLSTYTDTVFLFREKMVDYMLTPDPKAKFRGWKTPRIIKSKSYYRFTNAFGLDSVGRECNNHFSWSDWIGIVEAPAVPPVLCRSDIASDTVRGKYSPTEIWMRRADRLTIDIDVLADTTSRRWVPNLSAFFRRQLDFERFRVRFNYDNFTGDSIADTDLTGYSFNIESNGRGHNMFRFNHKDEPFFVNTFAEVYILDKEYITVKEARKWDKRDYDADAIEMLVAPEAPALQPAISLLVARVDAIDSEGVRLDQAPDRRYVALHPRNEGNIATRALDILKNLTGISSYLHKRNQNKNWNDFRRGQINRHQ